MVKAVSAHQELALLELDFESGLSFVSADVPSWCHSESRHVAQHVVVEAFAGCPAMSEGLRTIAFECLLVGIVRYHPVVVRRVCEETVQDDVPEQWDIEWHKFSLGHRVGCRQVTHGDSLPRS